MADTTVGTLRIALEVNAATLESEFQKATFTVGQFSKFVDKAGADLNRLVERFSGQRLVTEATTIAGAIEKIGGVSKLTDRELQAVARTVNEATAKLKAMGAEVPTSLAALKGEMDKLGTGTSKTTGLLGGFGGALKALGPLLPISSVAGLAAGIIRLGFSAMESADRLTELQGKTGLSLDTLQKLTAVAEQTGTSIETFSKGSFQLGVNLANGLTKTKDAVKDLGLSFADLRASTPETQLWTTIRALEQVADVTQRNALGVALYGKAWADIAPAVDQGVSQIAEATRTLTDEQIRVLAEAEAAWQRLKQTIKLVSAEIFADIAKTIQMIGLLGGGHGTGSLLVLTDAEKALIQTMQASGKTFQEAIDQILRLRTAAEEFAKSNKMAVSHGAAAVAAQTLAQQLAELEGRIRGLSQAQKTELNAAIKLGNKEATEYAEQIGIGEAGLRLYEGRLREAKQALDKTTAAMREAESAQAAWDREQNSFRAELAKNVQSLVDFAEKASLKSLTKPGEGVAAAERLTEPLVDAYLRAWTTMTDARRAADTRIRESAMNTYVFELDQLRRAGDEKKRLIGRDVIGWREAHAEIDRDTETALAAVVADYKDAILEINAQTKTISGAFAEAFGELPNILEAALVGGGGVMGGIQALFTKLGAGITGALFQAGGPLSALGGKLSLGIGNIFGNVVGDAFGMLLPGIGSLLGPLVGKIGSWFAGLFGGVSEEVKQARTDLEAFQKTLRATLTEQDRAGRQGWEQDIIAISKAYVAMGKTIAEAEADARAMWDTDHPERSKDAIERVNEALKAHQQLLEESTEQAGELFDEIMDLGREGIPAAMRPAIEQLIALGLLTDEQAAKLRGLGDAGAVNVDKMTAAMQLLKGRMESLGPAFRQANIDQTAQSYINAIETLIRGGGDVGGVLFDAREEIAALVRDSLKFGTTIPANMQPWIEELARTGNLIDENEQITDVSQLKFGEAIKTEADIAREGWEQLLAKIDELIARLTVDLPRALDKLPKNLGIGVETPPPAVNHPWGGEGGAALRLGGGLAFDPADILAGLSASLTGGTAPPLSAGAGGDQRLAAAVLAALATMERTMTQFQMSLPIVMRDAVRGAI